MNRPAPPAPFRPAGFSIDPELDGALREARCRANKRHHDDAAIRGALLALVTVAEALAQEMAELRKRLAAEPASRRQAQHDDCGPFIDP